ncbi:MAG: winged helix-turn-helix domain-containing protein [Thermodesulfovibrio sp.]|uniref:winged helix-turn-helix domain-containing protein n=1 Tax=unclassified Thermodesulfovibrio TaxID=2645936 RepID=UPI0008568A10|nr:MULTISPECIES: winged helix-turn-helix domain-containing protein [unclassified Thermodesulfovibrio]MDI6714943.1 winged helix-turn-helix domain-containing protein [Thermodesulfovibrio sp.]ODA44802.1 Mrr restriction system protein [Thermodesulfovibrio sp. N1]
MLPLLRLLGDGNERPFSELVNQLADYFKLTQEERGRKVPSGTQSIFYGRVNWAKTYLKKQDFWIFLKEDL